MFELGKFNPANAQKYFEEKIRKNTFYLVFGMLYLFREKHLTNICSLPSSNFRNVNLKFLKQNHVFVANNQVDSIEVFIFHPTYPNSFPK